ncbi:MAG: 3-deoxy-7-phosphoheptulonate synthase [Thermoplasmata archaeon]
MDSSMTFREVTLYGKKIFITESSVENEESGSIKDALIINSGLHSRKVKQEPTYVQAGNVRIGKGRLIIAAGPCAVESEDQLMEIGENVKKLGADMLRGGAFKPRTTPYTFQGLGKEGIRIMRKVSEATGLPTVSEIMDISDYIHFDGNIDMLQVGSRNSQNFSLLRFLGQREVPVLLKNGMGNTISEWLNSAEYILSGGNGNVVMCYRGVRGFEDGTRFTMDSGAIPVLRERSHLPICADPSHPAGKREYVESLAMAAVAAGADMLEIEVHNNPEKALSDARQQLDFERFSRLIKNVRKLREIIS